MFAMIRRHSKASSLDVSWLLSLIGVEETTQAWQHFWQPLPSGHDGWYLASVGCRYAGSIGQLIDLLKQCLRGKPCYHYCSFRYQY